MSVRFSCAVCHALFRVPVCNTVLEYASECDLIWASGLCWADWFILSCFFGESKRKDHYCEISGFLYVVSPFIFLGRLLRTILVWSFLLTSFE